MIIKVKPVKGSNLFPNLFRAQPPSIQFSNLYKGGSKSFRPDIQKPRQLENAARDIQRHLW